MSNDGITLSAEHGCTNDLLTRITVSSTTCHFAQRSNIKVGIQLPASHTTAYYYVTNLQGDVIAILDSAGTAVVQYMYDAWGRLLSDEPAANSIGNLNPLRYRGYVYDDETDLYYLQSRYYNPAMGRFISSDIAVSTGQGFSGNNAFAYCGNNPVVRSDDGGNAWETVWDILSLGSSILDVAMNPKDPWAWIGLAGDLIDVAVPFVGGIGEATRAVNAALNVTEALDDVHDASKVIDDLAEATIKCDGLCFVAGTKILAEDGTKNIECVQTGDLVWAWDEATDTVALKEVVETYINKTHELVHVFVDGQEIIATPSHPFYSPVKGWTEAVHLCAGDILVLVNGEYVVVEKVQHEILETPVTVYNFQVEDYHTYYVTDAGVLVHNKCTRNTVVSSREEALEYGRKFLGEGYTKEGSGRYVSADRLRQMRFDFTHHDGTTHHINLETFKYEIQKGKRNKLIADEHVFW